MQANQHWDAEADALVKNDLERTQSLFLAAPSVSRRVNKLKVDIIMINFIRGSFVIFKMNICICMNSVTFASTFEILKVDAYLIASWDKQVAESQKKKPREKTPFQVDQAT